MKLFTQHGGLEEHADAGQVAEDAEAHEAQINTWHDCVKSAERLLVVLGLVAHCGGRLCDSAAAAAVDM